MMEEVGVIELDQTINIDWCSIFNTFAYFNLHRNQSSYYFALQNISSKEILGVCHFSETEGVVKSPRRGSFGGFELKEDNLEYLIYFVDETEKLLKQKGVKEISLVAAPFQYNPIFSSQLFNTLYNCGYTLTSHELNYALPVDEVELIEKMNRNNKKRLKKCVREGFIFEQVFTEAEFEIVYGIISVNRSSKGYQLSMTFDQIIQMQRLFNQSLYFFKASWNAVDVASAICIRISETVLYVFYWGDLPGYEQHSPVSFVSDGIYKFAQQNKFKLLDAGTSTMRGVPNLGLIKFKKSLGFEESLKLSYIKSL